MILGAGAAGMMCAAEAGRGGGRVLVVDHARAAGEKIRISGGGRCNFTNMHAEPGNFLSQNPHFAKSALSRYTQWDFLDLVGRHGIDWHEKTLGQLFCDGSAKEIIAMLRAEMDAVGADLWLETSVEGVSREGNGFRVALRRGDSRHDVSCRNLVVATGGKSIPKMGATGLGYALAEQFGLPLVPTRAALVPLTFSDATLPRLKALAGLSVDATVETAGTRFREGLLFTHRGLSGPSVLQISSYWTEGQDVVVDLSPDTDLGAHLRQLRAQAGRQAVATALASVLPKRLAQDVADRAAPRGNLADQSDAEIDRITAHAHAWCLRPAGTEGYRTAEVTLGGVDTAALSSRTMEARDVRGLYFIGEVVDVTGWLGGFNFQWAWSSGWAAGQAIAAG
ncbi:membrane protein [Loktanella sp. 22II-4b]|uniref:NAD(P)/FAD-dependent oxidoreductase n=1 Tax=Brevirhabdus pacifica TaxID=1267768 RepID=UPI000B665D7B|nr:NAD(P)/FAD-dependent oxidoreductase [Brevirhabdus pacifica]OWU78809.1 membrane protein [Loktanella sp. 22II-4b]